MLRHCPSAIRNTTYFDQVQKYMLVEVATVTSKMVLSIVKASQLLGDSIDWSVGDFTLWRPL